MHIAPDGSWLQLRRDGGLLINFHRDNSRGSDFRRVHNDLLRWSIMEGPVTLPPKLISASVYSAEGSTALFNAATAFPTDAVKYFTAEQRQRASEAAQLHDQIGHPSDAVLTPLYIKSPSLTNCNLSAQDVVNMREIEGPCPVCMAGKSALRRGKYCWRS